MPKKIVIKVGIRNEKCRTKAMKIAAVAKGVNSMSIEGEEKDQVVVIGDGIDSVQLTNVLRKKLRHATLLSVQEVDPKQKEKEKETKPIEYVSCYSSYPQPSYPYYVVHDPYPNNCSIM